MPSMLARIVAGGLLAICGLRGEQLAPGVELVNGPVNGVLIEREGKRLAIYGDSRRNPPPVEQVLFTHHRRDAVWAGREMVRRGASAVVPAAEAQQFTGVQRFWEEFRTARFHDYAQQTSKILAEPLAAARTVRGGDFIEWRGLRIQVLDTPGYTRGAVSYLFEAGGKRIACVGDLIYGDGQILDIYSLQDAVPEAKTRGYHGYAARAAAVVASLRRVMEANPDLLVPARGPVIRSPREAAAKLIGRLEALFRSHFETDALRWYWGDDNLRIRARGILGDGPIDWMPMAGQARLPEWVTAIDNSRLIVSRSGAAFLIDCGSRRILDRVRQLRDQGRLQKLDGIWITHYHDDHTDAAQEAAAEFQCPVIATAEQRDILENPAAYRVPCLTRNPVRHVQVAAENSKRRWNEFEFTQFFFPGQTLYHDGLLAAKDGGEQVLFAGDSFTPSGMDDYCLLNRDIVRKGEGFFYCLDRMKRLPSETWFVNQHVEPMWRFTPAQLDYMERSLDRRAAVLAGLFPFDDANYGIDEQWTRYYPYGLTLKPGESFESRVVIRNHSPRGREFTVRPHAPAGWKIDGGPLRAAIPARGEGHVTVRGVAPADFTGTALLTADVAFGEWDLREWIEALLEIR